MNGIDKITARIVADASAEIARTGQETEQRCAEIRAQGEKQAQDRYWERLRQGMKGVEDRGIRLAGTADMEAKKSILAFKQETVASAFEQARQKLLAMSGDEYIRFLADKAAAASVTGREELIFNEADQSSVAAKVCAEANKKLRLAGKSGEMTVSGQIGSFAGGLVIRQGSIEINCSIDALLQQAREELSAQVAVTLFA